ncbi:MAG: YggT family protein [Acetivibrionales bacterium]|jgi:YggT family protein
MNYLIYRALGIVFSVIEIAIFARVIISWLPISRENKLIILLYQITEPILAPIRALIQRSVFGRNMMFDFSPIIAYLLIRLARSLILSILF